MLVKLIFKEKKRKISKMRTQKERFVWENETNHFALSRQYDFYQLHFHNNCCILAWFYSSLDREKLFCCSVESACCSHRNGQIGHTVCFKDAGGVSELTFWSSAQDSLHCFTSDSTSFIIIVFIFNCEVHEGSSAHNSCEECLRLVTVRSMCVYLCVCGVFICRVNHFHMEKTFL